MSDQLLQNDVSREALSALVDGQARSDELTQILSTWKTSPETKSAWRDYQLLGDVMRSSDLAQGEHSDRFLEKLRARMAQEPVVMAPAAARVLAQSSGTSVEPFAVPRSRKWWGPAGVAAGFMMIVGAFVSALAPVVSVSPDAFVSQGHGERMFAQHEDAAFDTLQVAPVASALLPSSGSISYPSHGVESFSRFAHVGFIHGQGVQTAPSLELSVFMPAREASFASYARLTRAVAHDAP